MKTKSTRQQLKAINGVHCLYRHEGTGEYYGIKKHQGKIRTKCLEVSDRKLAEAKLAEWITEIEGTTGGVISFHDLVKKWFALVVKQNPKSESTFQITHDQLLKFWRHNPQTQNIKVSEILDFLGDMRKKYAATTFNTLARRTQAVFELAKNDNNIVKNPFDSITKRQRYQKVVMERRHIPTEEEFKRIVHHIRTQRWSDTREEAADLAEFMSYAALGTAEVHNLRWEDINFNKKEIIIRRQKTQKDFYVPFYPWLATWLDSFAHKKGFPKKGEVFKVRCIKGSLRNACQKLKLPRFSPRDLRKLGIERVLRAGLSYELTAQAQGHKDSSLIQKVYRYVTSGDEQSYRDLQIAKMKNILNE